MQASVSVGLLGGGSAAVSLSTDNSWSKILTNKYIRYLKNMSRKRLFQIKTALVIITAIVEGSLVQK
jgi:hypothetical protein